MIPGTHRAFFVRVCCRLHPEQHGRDKRSEGSGAGATVTVERLAGGNLRCTGATWSDAVVIYPGEALALVNIECPGAPSAPRLPRGCGTETPRRHPRSR